MSQAGNYETTGKHQKDHAKTEAAEGDLLALAALQKLADAILSSGEKASEIYPQAGRDFDHAATKYLAAAHAAHKSADDYKTAAGLRQATNPGQAAADLAESGGLMMTATDYAEFAGGAFEDAGDAFAAAAALDLAASKAAADDKRKAYEYGEYVKETDEAAKAYANAAKAYQEAADTDPTGSKAPHWHAWDDWIKAQTQYQKSVDNHQREADKAHNAGDTQTEQKESAAKNTAQAAADNAGQQADSEATKK